MNTNQLLSERGNTHGRFCDNAALTDKVMQVFQASPKWEEAPAVVRVAIFMIVHKISRALSGSVLFDDHWRDVIGYAELVLNSIVPKK